MINEEFIESCIHYAKNYRHDTDSDDFEEDNWPTTTASSTISSLGLGGHDDSSATSFTPDPHAVSQTESLAYYSGLASQPRLLYRTGAPWSPPRGPEAQRRRKELREVFNHPLVALWNNGLAWKVVDIMNAHGIHFTTLDVIRFQMVDSDDAQSDEEGSADEDDGEETAEDEKKPAVGPVTIWVGVFPGRTLATPAHEAAQVILGLLAEHKINHVDVDFRESLYRREAGPQLFRLVSDLDPLVDVITPLTPVLGVHISTAARSSAQGTMGLYLAEGGKRDRLLGLTCNHVLFNPNEGSIDYVYHRSSLSKKVILLSRKAYTKLTDSIKLKIAHHGFMLRHREKQIQHLVETEQSGNPEDAAKAKRERMKIQTLLLDLETAVVALTGLLPQVEKQWKKIRNRIIGHIVRAPAVRLGVGEEKFTEDWGVFSLSRDKLGQGFQGNKIDLGTKMDPADFTLKCFPRGDANWHFVYPKDRLLQLHGIISDELMRAPDMWDQDGESCLLVVKNGSATNTTLGRANGAFSIVRDYSISTDAYCTSMEWGIINYDGNSDVFSMPGDSGAVIADIRGRIGGLLTGSAGKTKSSDMTYATPFWWLLRRIKASGLPNVNLNVFE